MVDFECKSHYGIQDLLRIMELLRSPEGCPWDRAQTHQSIRRNMLEEAYEAAEAIDENDPAHLKEELGDVLLQVVFHARMAQEAGWFDFDDVVNGVAQKLVFRHPYVFGDGQAADADGALNAWERQKRQEKDQRTNIEEELGDLLFVTAKAGCFLGLDSELALHAACEKFIRRFRTVEQLADKPLDQLDVPALEALWRQAKARERQEQPQG